MDQESAHAAAEKVATILTALSKIDDYMIYKAEAIRIKVGFPVSPDTRNPASIASYYSRVIIHEDTFFDNMLSARSVSPSNDVNESHKCPSG